MQPKTVCSVSFVVTTVLRQIVSCLPQARSQQTVRAATAPTPAVQCRMAAFTGGADPHNAVMHRRVTENVLWLTWLNRPAPSSGQ